MTSDKPQRINDDLNPKTGDRLTVADFKDITDKAEHALGVMQVKGLAPRRDQQDASETLRGDDISSVISTVAAYEKPEKRLYATLTPNSSQPGLVTRAAMKPEDATQNAAQDDLFIQPSLQDLQSWNTTTTDPSATYKTKTNKDRIQGRLTSRVKDTITGLVNTILQNTSQPKTPGNRHPKRRPKHRRTYQPPTTPTTPRSPDQPDTPTSAIAPGVEKHRMYKNGPRGDPVAPQRFIET